MPFTHKYTLVCDEVRQENNGKLIVIGLYTDKIAVPQMPFQLPALSFLYTFDADGPGDFRFRAKLENLESGNALAQAMGVIQVVRPGAAVSVLGFRNINLERIGTYTMSLNIDEQEDPITTSIEVILQPQQPPHGE